jgi:hypothetical protein
VSDHETIELDGKTYSLGLVGHPLGRVSTLPVFEDKVAQWTEVDLLKWVKEQGGKKRNFFDLTWVKNQGSHGSCAGFAAAACLEKARFLRGLTRVKLSGAYLYSLCNGNKDNGSMLEDHMHLVASKGAPREELVSTNQIFRTQYDTKAADEDAANHRGFEPYAIADRLGLMTAVAAFGPVEVAVHVGGNFDKFDSDGFCGSSNGGGNHAVHIDDMVMIDGKVAFCAVNNWSTTWGPLKGRMLFDWDRHLARPWENHVAFAIRSTRD